jgi:hypothetical protein
VGALIVASRSTALHPASTSIDRAIAAGAGTTALIRRANSATGQRCT